jgi:hypothetical protein
LLDNEKEGLGNFSGGSSPHSVNHIYLSLYCIVYLLCFIYTFFLILFLCDHVFLTNNTFLNACANLELGGYEIEQSSVNYLEKVLEIFLLLWNKLFGSGVTRVSRFGMLWTMVGRRWMIIVFFSEYDLNNILLDILLWK